MKTCTLFIPGLAWLDAADGAVLCKDLKMPALSHMLGKGHLQSASQTSSEWWMHELGISSAVAANLARQAGLPEGRWLLADPVNLRIDRDRALLGDVGIMNLSQEEADALLTALNEFFAEDGLKFHAPTPARWLVQLPEASGAGFHPLTDVIGEDINRFLPHGPRGMLWSRYLNELQMLLYNHPVNNHREQRGEPTVNSVWFWGESSEVLPVQARGRKLLTADVMLQALCQQSAIHCDMPPYAFSDDLLDESTESLICLDFVEAAAQFRDVWGWQESLSRLDREWLQPLLLALRAGKLSTLVLQWHGEAGGELRLKRTDLLKFWRRPAKLERLYPDDQNH